VTFLHHGTYRVKVSSLANLACSVNALRHVTYRERAPWMPEADLVLQKTLGERIRYIRENLIDESGEAMTQPAFAEETGLARGHHGVMRWEKGSSEPRPAARRKIAALSGDAYRPEVFSRAGAEEIVVETAVPLLQSLATELDEHRALIYGALRLLQIEVLREDPQEAPTVRRARRQRAVGGSR
jgi:DNA-binding transcriptional regulator YiaG